MRTFMPDMEINGILVHLCAHIGQTGPEKPPEDSEIKEMTQDSKFEPWRSEAEHETSRSREASHNIEFL